jgi:CubicO group peptidase (beta-lactamase class C family)
VCASAADVIGFARLHLEDGLGVVSPASVKAMQQRHVLMPGESDTGFGLGWLVRDIDGVRTVGHNGGTLGQYAFLALFPDHGVAIALVTNGPTGALVWQDVTAEITSELGLPLLKVVYPTPPTEPPQLDLAKYVGRYERRAVHSTVSLDDGALTLGMEYVGVEYDLRPPPPVPIVPVDAETFVAIGPDGAPAMSVQFLEPDADGEPQLFFASRMARRTA